MKTVLGALVFVICLSSFASADSVNIDFAELGVIDFAPPDVAIDGKDTAISELRSSGYVSLPTLCVLGCSVSELESHVTNDPLMSFVGVGTMNFNGMTVGMSGNPTWKANDFDISFTDQLDFGAIVGTASVSGFIGNLQTGQTFSFDNLSWTYIIKLHGLPDKYFPETFIIESHPIQVSEPNSIELGLFATLTLLGSLTFGKYKDLFRSA